MFNKNLLSYIFIIMFSFFCKTEAKYDKLFFELSAKTIDGKELNFSKFKDKAILLVNVASKCGFTSQYADLQLLYETYKDKGFVVIGFPSNQFGGQEPGTNSEIKDFCETNFNITFPITYKINVKGPNTNSVYTWAKKNFGNSAVPKWNFHKILINKNGKVESTYGSFVKPMSKKVVNKLNEILN